MTNIERIQLYETYLDELLEVECLTDIYKSDDLKSHLKILIHYYESGQWLNDYTLDELGYLPKTLKRGILSQDTLYDFLQKIDINKL